VCAMQMKEKTNERATTSAVIRRRGKDVIKSAGRSLEVLELFRDAQQPLRLTDIATALSLPQSSASMLIRSLISMGYLIRQGRNYAPSIRITLLGSWLNDTIFSQGNLMSLIAEVSHLTGDTVILGTRNGLFVEVLAVMPGRMDTMHHTRPGEGRSLTRALMGHMILSAMKRTEAEGLVMRINAEQKRSDRRVKFQTLIPMLDRIRQNGYGYTEGTLPGAANVAVLLPPGPFGDPLVLGNAGTIERIRPRREEILNLVNATIKKYLRGVR
jgi:DNA-binding IclR family transcriptional regulator